MSDNIQRHDIQHNDTQHGNKNSTLVMTTQPNDLTEFLN
jgi:hypothetical protein